MVGGDRRFDQGRKRKFGRIARANVAQRLHDARIGERLQNIPVEAEHDTSQDETGSEHLAGSDRSSGSEHEGQFDERDRSPEADSPPLPNPPPSPSNPPSSPSNGASSGHEDSDADADNTDADDSDDDIDMIVAVQNLNEDEREEYLLEQLRDWAQRGITKCKVDDMLRILKPLHPFLPRSSKTLLKTPRSTDFLNVGDGKLWYKGIAVNIPQNLSEQYLNNHGELVLDVNMDGLEIHRNSDKEFWPILGCFEDGLEPFIIAIHYGVGKPSDLDLYLQPFIQEVQHLQVNGYSHRGVVFPFRVRHYILDAPARSFVKQCIGHGGYFSCEKCSIRGRWYMQRMTYVGGDHPLRSDESYAARETPHHHTGISPLEQIGTGMVSQFRLDGMHLAYLGVCKRMISFLFFKRSNVKLDGDSVQAINDFMCTISSCFPLEFNRPPRGVGNEHSKAKWKATEYRRFALYDSIVALKDRVEARIYRCFLLFHAGLFILSSPALYLTMNDAAEYLLEQFVTSVGQVFGIEFVVYNVHSLKHLAKECRDCNAPLDNFSAFKFENFMKTLRDTLKAPVKPLQQLARRDKETNGKLMKPKQPINNERPKLLNRRQHRRPENFEGIQFCKLSMKGFCLSVKRKADRCFTTKSGDIVILYNILRVVNRGVLLAGRKFLSKENFYDFPFESSTLGIFLFAVVKFIPSDEGEATVDIVPTKWLTADDQTYWPKGTSTSIKRLVMQYTDYDEKWSLHDIKVLHKYSTYNKALKACKKAEEQSDIDTAAGESDVGRKRNRNKPARYDSESEIEMPTKRYKKVKVLSSESEAEDESVEQIRSKVSNLIKLTKKPKTVSPVSLPKKNDKKNNENENSPRSPVSIASTVEVTPQKKKTSSPSRLVRQNADLSADLLLSATKRLRFHEADEPSTSSSLSRVKPLPSLHKRKASRTYTGDGPSFYISPVKSNSSLFLSPVKNSRSPFKQSPARKKSPVKSSKQSAEGCLKIIMEQLEEVNTKQDFLIARVELLQKTISPDDETAIARPKGLPSLPLKTEEAFEKFEKYLSVDTNFNLTMLYLKALCEGAQGLKDATAVLLKKLISNQLSRIISYGGSGGSKIKFCDSTVMECMICAIKSAFKKVTDLGVVKVKIQRWFTTSAQRKLTSTPTAA